MSSYQRSKKLTKINVPAIVSVIELFLEFTEILTKQSAKCTCEASSIRFNVAKFLLKKMISRRNVTFALRELFFFTILSFESALLLRI